MKWQLVELFRFLNLSLSILIDQIKRLMRLLSSVLFSI